MKNPELVQFTPLPEQLQSGTTLLTREPLGKPSTQGHGIEQSAEDARLPTCMAGFLCSLRCTECPKPCIGNFSTPSATLAARTETPNNIGKGIRMDT
jgi:hypothetical protein